MKTCRLINTLALKAYNKKSRYAAFVRMIMPGDLGRLTEVPKKFIPAVRTLIYLTTHHLSVAQYGHESIPKNFNEQACQQNFDEQEKWIQSEGFISGFQTTLERFTSCQSIIMRPHSGRNVTMRSDAIIQRFVDIILKAAAGNAQIKKLEISIPGLRLDMLNSTESTFANLRCLWLGLDVSELETSEKETWGSTLCQLLQQCQQLKHLGLDLRGGTWHESNDEPTLSIPKLESLRLRSLVCSPTRLTAILRCHKETIREITLEGVGFLPPGARYWATLVEAVRDELHIRSFSAEKCSVAHHLRQGSIPTIKATDSRGLDEIFLRLKKEAQRQAFICNQKNDRFYPTPGEREQLMKEGEQLMKEGVRRIGEMQRECTVDERECQAHQGNAENSRETDEDASEIDEDPRDKVVMGMFLELMLSISKT